MSKNELALAERLLLQVVVAAAPPDGQKAITTKDAHDALLVRLRATGESFSLVGHAPWFGLSVIAERLEQLGLIEVDHGMAEYHPPTEPTPSPRHYFLIATEQALHLSKAG